MSRLQQDASGVTLQFTVTDAAGDAFDLSAADILQVVLEKPSGAIVHMTATPITTGVDGGIETITAVGDLDEAGTYRTQVYVEIGTLKSFTTASRFKVAANLE